MGFRVDTGGTIQWFVLNWRYRIGNVAGYASPLEVGAVSASPVSLLEEFSIDSIRGDCLIRGTGRYPHLVEKFVPRIFPVRRLQAEQAVKQGAGSVARHSPRASIPEWEKSSSWRLLDVPSPLDPFKPILMYGREPSVGFMCGNPGIEKIDKVGISLVDGETRLCFKQGF